MQDRRGSYGVVEVLSNESDKNSEENRACPRGGERRARAPFLDDTTVRTAEISIDRVYG
jgi:hypothetical protein